MGVHSYIVNERQFAKIVRQHGAVAHGVNFGFMAVIPPEGVKTYTLAQCEWIGNYSHKTCIFTTKFPPKRATDSRYLGPDRFWEGRALARPDGGGR